MDLNEFTMYNISKLIVLKINHRNKQNVKMK